MVWNPEEVSLQHGTWTHYLTEYIYTVQHAHIFLIGIGSKLSMTRNMSQGSVTQNFCKSYSIQQRYSVLNVSLHAQPAMRTFLLMLRQQWNIFRVCSASDEIHSACSAYFWFWNVCDFPLCSACMNIGYSLSEHAWNRLLIGWTFAKIG